jgi:hypothetical protein
MHIREYDLVDALKKGGMTHEDTKRYNTRD